jgi:hypothetical protein
VTTGAVGGGGAGVTATCGFGLALQADSATQNPVAIVLRIIVLNVVVLNVVVLNVVVINVFNVVFNVFTVFTLRNV